MTDRLNIAAVQANPTVGAIDANAALAARRLDEATAAGADLALFPELFLIGYPPEDLALKPAAVAACRAALERLAPLTKGRSAALIGLPWPSGEGAGPMNACALVADGEIKDVTFKVDLPNYGVFDEKRVFTPGPGAKTFDFKGFRIGVPVCEDVWGPDPLPGAEGSGRRDPAGPQRLALPAHGRGRADGDRAPAHRRGRPAADLRQPGGRPGRAGVRRRLVCPAGGWNALHAACRCSRRRSASRAGSGWTASGAASTRPSRRGSRRRRRSIGR